MRVLREGEGGGIEPVRRLLERSRVWSEGRVEREVGMGPDMRLEVIETRRREELREGGRVPEMRPGKTMSSVRKERVERDAGRVPVSPGESERPVPRESEEIRR